MSTQYYVTFYNDTDRTWIMVLYQIYPGATELESLAWKMTTVPPSGSSGMSWTESNNVGLASYRQANPNAVYEAIQVLETELGTEWEIVFQDGVQQLKYEGTLASDMGDHVLIHNKSGLVSAPCVGMDGIICVGRHDVLSNVSTLFKVTPTYWVGLFEDVQSGEVINNNVEVGPLQLDFSGGANAAKITAVRKGESIVFGPPEYSTSRV